MGQLMFPITFRFGAIQEGISRMFLYTRAGVLSLFDAFTNTGKGGFMDVSLGSIWTCGWRRLHTTYCS